MFPTLNSVNEVHPHVDNKTKRILTIDQVNKQFPVMTYKLWKAIRDKDGLFTGSAITVHNPPIHDNPDRKAVQRSDTGIAVQCSNKPETTDDVGGISTDNAQAINIIASVLSNTNHCETKAEDVPPGQPPQFVGVVEDKCAICLEVPEDDDDVRSLKCGHCYHQTCIDPWLTSQSGACPLCKRDFYVSSDQRSTAGRENTLLWAANEHRSPHETLEPNTNLRNDLAPLPPAITRVSWVSRMNGSWDRMHTALPLPLFVFRRERPLGRTGDESSQLERGEM